MTESLHDLLQYVATLRVISATRHLRVTLHWKFITGATRRNDLSSVPSAIEDSQPR